MDNNSNRKSSGLIALIVVAIIVITVIIIAVVTSRNDKNDMTEAVDTVEDQAETRITDAVSEVRDDLTELGDKVSDAIFGEDTTDTDTDTTDSSTMTSEPETETDTSELTVSLPTEFALPVTGHIMKGHSIDMPVFSLTMNDYRTHNGIDITAVPGSEVACFADGSITDKYVDPFMGVCLEVSHSGGMISKYMGLSEEFPEGIEVGAQVKVGQNIAFVGESAALEASDDPHLHFEVILNDINTDPMEYIDADLTADEEYE